MSSKRRRQRWRTFVAVDLAPEVSHAWITAGPPAHITLGRVGGRRGWSRLEIELSTRAPHHFDISRVSQVEVLGSEPRRGGSVYTLLRTVNLDGR